MTLCLSIRMTLKILIFILIFRTPLLNLLYNSTNSSKYILILSLPFSIYHLESPISAALTSLSLNKETIKIGIYSSFTRIITLILSLEYFGILSVAISELAGIVIYLLLGLYYTLKSFSSNNVHTFFSK